MNELYDIKKVNDDFTLYPLKKKFRKIGYIQPIIEREKLEYIPIEKDSDKITGAVYCFVIDNKIFKIGQTITSMKDRIRSYNCGKKAYRENGTCSTTNYKILQSFLNWGKNIDVYILEPPTASFIDIFGNEIITNTITSKITENQCIDIFEKTYGHLPYGCIQH